MVSYHTVDTEKYFPSPIFKTDCQKGYILLDVNVETRLFKVQMTDSKDRSFSHPPRHQPSVRQLSTSNNPPTTDTTYNSLLNREATTAGKAIVMVQ